MSKNIFLVAGGTGGHLFPAIATSQKKSEFKYIFIVDKRVKNYLKKTKGIYHTVWSEKLSKNPINLLRAFVIILVGFLQSIFFLIKYKPCLIVGFGGYTSIPTILAGKLLGKKILLHEQNAVMGRTNRFLSLFCNRIALTFKKTKFAHKKSIYSGIPLRNEKILEPSKQKVLLVIGGSQGASIFSRVIPKVIEHIKSNDRKKIYFLQQVRIEDIDNLSRKLKDLKVKFKLHPFIENIQSEINNSFIVISRCGSSSLAEIERFKKYSILLPLPTAIDNHQYYNAEQFKVNNECEIFDQNKLDYKIIAKLITQKLKQKNKFKKHKIINKISLNQIINDMLR